MGSINRARAIAREVASYRPDYTGSFERPVINPDAKIEDIRKCGVDIGMMVFKAMGHSHAVNRQAQTYIKPRGATSVLTRRTLALTAFADTSMRMPYDDVLDNCCLGAELKFVHGLDHHRLGKPSKSNHAAALILYDAQGEPCAYQKAVGYPYAYAWRDSLMRTGAGMRHVPAGAIVRPVYDREGQSQDAPHKKFAGAGLVAMQSSVPDDVVFMRFSVEAFPRALRRAALLDASGPDAYSQYRHHVAETERMNSMVFAGQIAELLQSTDCYRVV